MIEVGIRQLKNGLTRYIRLVEKGQSVLVTSRNRPVAILKKPDMNWAQTPEEKLAALAAAGKLIPAKERGPMAPFKPVKLRGKPLSQTILEDRR